MLCLLGYFRDEYETPTIPIIFKSLVVRNIMAATIDVVATHEIFPTGPNTKTERCAGQMLEDSVISNCILDDGFERTS